MRIEDSFFYIIVMKKSNTKFLMSVTELPNHERILSMTKIFISKASFRVISK